jgi:hypothetical protein
MELTRFDGHRCFHLCIGPGAHGSPRTPDLGAPCGTYVTGGVPSGNVQGIGTPRPPKSVSGKFVYSERDCTPLQMLDPWPRVSRRSWCNSASVYMCMNPVEPWRCRCWFRDL